MVNLYVLRLDKPELGIKSKKFSEEGFEKKFGKLKLVLKNTTNGKMYGFNYKNITVGVKRNPFKLKLISKKTKTKGTDIEINVVNL